MNRIIATLRVLETWKGEAFGEIRVGFPAGLICPAPPRYVEDEDVVAFLSRVTGSMPSTIRNARTNPSDSRRLKFKRSPTAS